MLKRVGDRIERVIEDHRGAVALIAGTATLLTAACTLFLLFLLLFNTHLGLPSDLRWLWVLWAIGAAVATYYAWGLWRQMRRG